MKKSRKLLCMLLALVMVVSLLPVMALQPMKTSQRKRLSPLLSREISPETAGIITDVFAKLPNYLVVVKTPWGTLAKGAQVVLYNQNSNTIVASGGRYLRRCRLHQGSAPEGLHHVRHLDAEGRPA